MTTKRNKELKNFGQPAPALDVIGDDPVQPLTVQDAGKNGIYVASKAKYGSEWKAMRDSGWPIVSTWINESGPGEIYDWPDLWSRCVSEAANSAALVVISREDDVLKGAWVELGAALAAGIPVFAVGISRYSIRHHPLITHYERETDAFDAALREVQAMIEQLRDRAEKAEVEADFFKSEVKLRNKILDLGCVQALIGEAYNAGWNDAIDAHVD